MLSSASVKTECIYRAAGCNRGTGTADIHPITDSIVYCGGNSVLVLRRTASRYTSTHYLPHSAPVKTVCWLKQADSEVAVLGCADGGVHVWNVASSSKTQVCKHAGAVVYVDAIRVQDVTYIVSSGADSEVKIHTHTADNTIEIFASITIPRCGFAHSCSVSELQGSLLLALGTDDSSVMLYHLHHNTAHLLTKLIGHEDWVRGLDFKTTETGAILASGSQDNYIRLWSISRASEDAADGFKLQEKMIKICGAAFSVKVESILLGHENWVSSVRWMSDGRLLSASMDKTLIVWHQDDEGLWSESVHVGEVGGNNLGLFGAFPTADCSFIVSHSFQGAFQAWQSSDGGGWSPVPMPGGHFAAVKDISWAPSGNYLISASTDQSVRVTAEWTGAGWYEIARSQVHGHDMSCVDCISDSRYVSGSEEKVLRVFQATSTFDSNLQAISGCTTVKTDVCPDVIGAHIPSLGLSNKAICTADMDTSVDYKGTATTKDYDIPYQVAFAPASLSKPPVEEILLQNTLWPELHKLYGHGYEVYQCAAAPDGTTLATSCKAAKQQFAAIILWECENWTKIGELVHHNLTVTRLKFSPDSQFLLSVSRDRDWAVWNVAKKALAGTSPPKCHARIIWDCAWYRDGTASFASVSRDKKLKLWDREGSDVTSNIGDVTSNTGDVTSNTGDVTSNTGDVTQQDSWVLGCARGFEVSVTAVDVSPEGFILVGFETGELAVLRRVAAVVELVCSVSKAQCPALTVNTVQWRPRKNDDTNNTSDVTGRPGDVTFAACSDDNSLVLMKLVLPELYHEE